MVNDTLDSLFEHFAQYIKLSPVLKDAIAERMQPITFKKGELVHNADMICRESYFIQKGIMRTYFLKDGKEITEYFVSENEWINSPRSMIQQKLDIYYIDVLEDTTAFKLKMQHLGYLFDNFPEMERYSRLSMGSLFGHFIERITSLRFTTAKEKYDHFLSVYADIYPRLPLGMVASYLGITQETLSRIRAEK